MKVIGGTEEIPPELKNSFITIGNFDGVHLGHRHIFKSLISEARKANSKALLVSFNPHPKMILRPELRPFYLLTTLEEKTGLLEEAGLDAFIVIPFSPAYAQITAESFILDFLWGSLDVKKVFIGHDYTFGRAKGGNGELLAAYGKKMGFDVAVMSPFTLDGEVVSSTSIRKAILGGDVKKAAGFLGRPYNVRGTVVRGRQRGSALGFPTANIAPEKELLPARGIYAAAVILEGKRHKGVLNIGFNPTFGEEQLSLEVHILDFQGDLYGKTPEVLFLERIREERKFASPGALAQQIAKDVDLAREILRPYF